MTLVVNISNIGIDFKDGNCWKATKGKIPKKYQFEERKVIPSDHNHEVITILARSSNLRSAEAVDHLQH